MKQTLIFLWCLMCLPLAAKAQQPTVQKLRYRWFYLSTNLLRDENIAPAQELLRRAHGAGYNGVLLSDYKFSLLDRMPDHYFENVRAVIAAAQKEQIEIFPTVCPIGYSSGILAHNPNLAEGVPVKEAPFVVKDGRANLAPVSSPLLKNGDFEAAKNDAFTGFNFQDGPGAWTFADTATKHGGQSSLRMENIRAKNPESGNSRIMQEVEVAPYRQYHLSVWVKTQDFETPSEARATILTPQGNSLSSAVWQIKRTQDWTQYHIVFNSLKNTKVRIYFGVWGGRSGTIWWDDAALEEVGLLNVLRRKGCPLVVKSENDTRYEEGRDFETVSDPKLGVVPWAGEYEVYHEAPAITLTANTRIHEGEHLRVSFYHAITTMENQVACCLSDPEVYAIMQDQVGRVQNLFHPKGFFLSHDELRVANWCEECQQRHLTPGQLLADNARRCVDMVHRVNSQAQIFIWSDMFDPSHNAHDDYYLVNGDLSGSWEGLDKDVVITNWNSGKRQQSMPFFAKRGHTQILAGYYDGSPQSIRGWLNDAKGIEGIDGVMYTTWQNRYRDLEAFARAAWGQ